MSAPTLPDNVEDWGVRDWAREEESRRRAEAGDAAPEYTPGRPFRDWAALVPERGLPMDMEHFPSQGALLSQDVADRRQVVIMKSTQVGVSMIVWRWAAYRADNGDRVIYYFPTATHVTDFGDQRIEPSIEDSDYLKTRVPKGSVRRKGLKEIGSGEIALRGLQSRLSVQSVDADALVFDEYDEGDPANIAQAERRLSGAQAAGRFPRIRRVGIPTVPGYGMDLLFQRTDRRLWHVTCPHCDLEQELTWERNVRWRTYPDGPVCRPGHDEYEDSQDVDDVWRICGSCEGILEGDGGPLYHGRWIAQNPGAEVVGFHITRLGIPRTDLAEIVRSSRKTKPYEVEAFWNNDLGLAYAPAEAMLTDADIDAAEMDGLTRALQRKRGSNPVTMGVDVASERVLSARVSEHLPDGRRRAIWIGEPENFDEVRDLIHRFEPDLTALDSQPERRMARELAAEFPGRVCLVRYDEVNPEADAFRYDQKKNMVTVNRTEAIDAMMDSIRQRKNVPLKAEPPRYRQQMMAPKRRTVLDTRERPRREYVSTGTAGDDYAHAEVYDLVASALLRAMRGQLFQIQQSKPNVPASNLDSDASTYYGGWGE